MREGGPQGEIDQRTMLHEQGIIPVESPHRLRRLLKRLEIVTIRRDTPLTNGPLREMPQELKDTLRLQRPARIFRRALIDVGAETGVGDPTIHPEDASDAEDEENEERRSVNIFANGFIRVGEGLKNVGGVIKKGADTIGLDIVLEKGMMIVGKAAEVVQKVYRATNDPIYWTNTYLWRGGYWVKANAFLDHPETHHQQNVFVWGMKNVLHDVAHGTKQVELEPTEEPLTWKEAMPLFAHNRLYRQTLLYVIGATPGIGPIVSLIGYQVENIGRALNRGEIRKGIQYTALAMVDILPTAIESVAGVLKAAIGIPTELLLKAVGYVTGANFVLTFAPTNTYRNEGYQDAYTRARIGALFTIADYFLTHQRENTKGQAVIHGAQRYIRSEIPKKERNNSERVARERENIITNLNVEIERLAGVDIEGVRQKGAIEIAKARYRKVKGRVAQRRYPPEGMKKKHVSVLLHTQLDYFEREIISLEEQLSLYFIARKMLHESEATLATAS